ncbi:thioredoxin domain-containing protein [Marmoricola sp. RAF53]|uniref:thioredoxin domain-containing protein n=1 Tax=Marmoricola sp. RAF53 TaxID=3233059 RepID=UPI003F9BACB3
MSKQNRDQSRAERAAAVRAEQARGERNRRLAIVVGILVVLGAIVAGGAWYASGGKKDSSATTSATVAAGDGSVVVGDDSAPVKVLIYEDFQCPYCRQLEQQTRDFLSENAADGKVQVEYRPIHLLTDLPYSAKALNAFAAVLAHGTPEEALKLHNILYDNQPYESDSASVTDADIADMVAQSGAKGPEIDAALKTTDTAFFAAADQAMQEAQVQGTPTVLVDGKQLTGTSVPDLVSQIETAVTNAG